MTETMKFATVAIVSGLTVLFGMFVPGKPFQDKNLTKEEAYNLCLTADENQLLSETMLRYTCYEEYSETV